MNIKKAKLLDSILLKFEGNKTITWGDIQEGAFEDIETYYVIENNLNYLIGDGLLERDRFTNTSLSLTDKGFATMTDLKNLGYLTLARKEQYKKVWAVISGVIIICTFLILIYDTWFKVDLIKSENNIISPPPKIDKKRTSDTVYLKKLTDSIKVNNDTINTSLDKLQKSKQSQ